MTSCNLNFISQFAYINDKEIHITHYNKNRNKNDKITCRHGHELVMCEGKKIKKYFRHKHSVDIGGEPMTEWHCRMQSYFPVTEFILKKTNEKQIKERRADAMIKEHDCIIEFEHSGKTLDEVICKSNDCSLHNMDIILVIDGNTEDIEVEEKTSRGFLITFKDDWKYKSFAHTYEFVLLDVSDKIFKVPVKNVYNKMILLKEWKPISLVMDILNKNPKQIWNEWEDDNEVKPTLTFRQEGAGNGKTHGIWKAILTNLDKDVFFIVTKTHSAVSVTLKELNDQAERNDAHVTDNIDSYEVSDSNKKHIIEYENIRSHRKCLIVIGTIDSLVWNLSTNKKSNQNFFEGVLQTIHEFGTNKIDKSTRKISYAGLKICLNTNMVLFVDESQDLDINYFNAVTRLMVETKIDAIMVGDKGQSLVHLINCMTSVENEIPNINIIRETPVNMNRRFKVNGLAQRVNKLVHFSEYSLPEISTPDNLIEPTCDPFEVIEYPLFDNNIEENRTRIEKFIDYIIILVDKEVTENDYLPRDFLFVFPIMKQNIIACELETKLNVYWIERNKDTDEYANYAIMHKHQEGQVIDMTMSENTARIVSISTSKGDGRNVTFTLGCTEEALKIVSRTDTINLVYESHLNVALTRAKYKIYFGLTKNNDDIHQRFGSNGMVEYIPKIKTHLTHTQIIDHLNAGAFIELLKKRGIEEMPEEMPTEQNKVTHQIDWEYHCIRRAIYLQYAVFTILEQNRGNHNFGKSQLKTILDKISKLPVNPRLSDSFYKYLKSFDGKLIGDPDAEMKEIPLCILSKKPIYAAYTQKIKRVIETNMNEYKKNCFSPSAHTPLAAVLQWYVIELYTRKQYHQTNPSTIYNIIDHFEKDDPTKITELLQESEIIKNRITVVMSKILTDDKTVHWNIEHMIKLNGNCCKEFEIWNRDMPIIGFGENTVYHFMFQSDFNKLNYWDTMIKVMVERFMLYNTAVKGNDVEKFRGKKLNTYIFILKQNRCEMIQYDWDNSDEFTTEVKLLVKDAVVKHFSTFNKQLYNYCLFIKKSDKWKDEFTSPYDYIANIYANQHYVRDFFKNLHERCKDNKSLVKSVTDDCDVFCKKMTETIQETCDKFFGLTEQNNGDDW